VEPRRPLRLSLHVDHPGGCDRVRAGDLIRGTDAAIELCRTISDAARQAGAVGLLAPSAALTGAVNLMSYQDGVAGGIDLAVGPARESIPAS
jgi:hypothetical protein